MRISEVKVGDTVIPRAWETDLPGVRTLMWRRPMCGIPTLVRKVDHTDNTVALAHPDDAGDVAWWPVDFCEAVTSAPQTNDQPNATQLLQRLHEREVTSLRQDIAAAQRAVEAATRLVQNRDREEQALRSQIAALEKQVADLKAERDRVGKTSQGGTRFAQLELD